MASALNPIARWRQRDDAGRRNRRTSITALDIDGGWLHVVHAALRGTEPRVLRHQAVPLGLPADTPPDSPEILGAAVAKALGSLRADTSQIVMGVPRMQAILRVLHLPPARSTAEIASMVHFQIGRDLPFRLDETVIDFRLLPESPPPAPAPSGDQDARTTPTPVPPPGTVVLAAVVRREKIAFFPAFARAAGIKLHLLGLRPLAGGLAAGWCEPQARQGCVALVSVQPGEINFDVLVDGTLVFSRVGSLPPPESEPSSVEPAVLEIVRSLHNYEGLPGHGQLSAFYLVGGTGTESAIAETLTHRSGIPAHRLDPATALAGLEGTQDHAGGALPAIGLALMALEPTGTPIDFLAPKNPPAPVDNRRLRRLAAVAGVIALILSVAGFRARLMRQHEAVRADLQQQVTLASKNLPGYRTTRAQAKSVNDWSAGGRNWLDHLTVLSTLLPPSRELHVTTLSTTPKNSLALSVRVRGGEVIDRLSADLRQAGFLVKPPGISPVNDRAGYRFQANLEIDAPAVVTNKLEELSVSPRPATPPPGSAPPPGTTGTTTTPNPAGARSNFISGPGNRPARANRRRNEGGTRE